MPHSGQCLCGEVKIQISSTHTSQIACHCGACKHASGSAYASMVLVKDEDVTVEGETKGFESTGGSGSPVTRRHCTECGSPISIKCATLPGKILIQTGNLDGFDSIPYTYESCSDDKWSVVGAFPGVAGEGK